MVSLLFCTSSDYYLVVLAVMGYAVVQLVEELSQAERLQVQFPMVSMEYFYIILRSQLLTEMSTRYIS